MALDDFLNPQVRVENPIENLTIVEIPAGATTPPHTHAEGYIVVPFWAASAERIIQTTDGTIVRRDPVALFPGVPYYVDATAEGQTTAFRNTGGGLTLFQKFVPDLAVKGPQPEILPLKTLTIVSNGVKNAFTVEVARTLRQKAVGLMFRPQLLPARGMVFVWSAPMEVAMYMRNVMVPLDFLFVDESSKISHVYANATPGDLTPIKSQGKCRLTLEIPGGSAASLGIATGDQIM